jgi:hypothetical protein
VKGVLREIFIVVDKMAPMRQIDRIRAVPGLGIEGSERGLFARDLRNLF